MGVGPALAGVLARVYYRLRVAGEAVPATGPVLLVANHPNSLLDPILVTVAAGRSVRFLAKAPLFHDRKTAWLVGLGRAIPVHRRQDDPGQMARNSEMFEAVHAALGSGDAVGLFPEGLSHSGPALEPLRTGAARIALGAAAIIGREFPIIPVGLVYRSKDVFRSRALVLRGAPLEWGDLAGCGAEDPIAVRGLTERISVALRRQTVNLQSWRDRPLVETAVRIWEVEQGAQGGAQERLSHLTETTRVLAWVRASGDPAGMRLADEVGRFGARLERLGLRPADLGADVSGRRGLRWGLARLPLILPLSIVVGLIGWLLFLIPYRVTGLIVDRFKLGADTRSTWKALIGSAVYIAWMIALVVVAWLALGGWWVLLVLAGLPLLGLFGLQLRERWRGAWGDARRFVLVRGRSSLMASLRERQSELGNQLDSLLQLHGEPSGES